MASRKSLVLDRDQLFILDQLLVLSFKETQPFMKHDPKYFLSIEDSSFDGYLDHLNKRFQLYKYIHNVILTLDSGDEGK